MMKKLAVAAALVLATAGLMTSASAGYGHRSHGYGHKVHFGHSYYKPVYTYRHYTPVYSYRHHYKPACAHYGWAYKHGYKVWTCLW